AIPIVEIANHADSLRVRRPHREINACGITDGAYMRAKFFVNLPVLAFGEEMQIDFPHDRPVLVGIACQAMRSVPSGDPETVRNIPSCVPDSRSKETGLMDFLRCDRLIGMLIQHDLDLARVRPKNAYFQILSNPVRTQDTEGIRMRPGNEAAHFVRR